MNDHVDKDISERLSAKHQCYVLITCDSPDDDGNMNVQMSYEGDSALAAYMIDGARDYLEEFDLDDEALSN